MALVYSEFLTPGMLLVKDARDFNGRLIAACGTVLTDKIISTFKAWGVTEVEVEGGEVPAKESTDSGEADAAVLEEIEVGIRSQFCLNDLAHPAIRELLRLCRARKAGVSGRCDG